MFPYMYGGGLTQPSAARHDRRPTHFNVNRLLYGGYGSRGTLLLIAVIKKDVAFVKRLLQEPSLNVNKRGAYRMRPLTQAVQGVQTDYRDHDDFRTRIADYEMVRLLLEHPKIDVNKGSGYHNCTPLMYAVEQSDVPLVKMLLDTKGLNVNQTNAHGQTALVYAESIQHKPIRNTMKALLQSHRDIHIPLVFNPNLDIGPPGRNREGERIAWFNEHAHVWWHDVPHGSPIRSEDSPYRNGPELMDAIRTGTLDAVEPLLTDPKTDVNYLVDNGTYVTSPLIDAVHRGNELLVDRLLAHPMCDVNLASWDGDAIGYRYNCNTALMWAANRGHLAVLNRLLRHPQIRVNHRHAVCHDSALMIAARHGHVAVVDRLLVVPDIDDSLPYNGELDAMMTATMNGHIAVIQRLLERPVVPFYSVRRSMEIAASTNRLDLLKLLMVSSHMRNNRERRQAKGKALMAALYAGHEETVDFLMRDGFVRSYHVNAKDRDGCTPLMKLCAKGHTELVARLLKVPGLRVNEVDGHNMTALRHALTSNRSDLVDLLLCKPDIQIPEDIMSHCWNDACKLVVSRAILKKKLFPEITRGCLFGRTKTGAPLPALPTEMERMIASYLLPTKEADIAVHNDDECEEEIDGDEEVVVPLPVPVRTRPPMVVRAVRAVRVEEPVLEEGELILPVPISRRQSQSAPIIKRDWDEEDWFTEIERNLYAESIELELNELERREELAQFNDPWARAERAELRELWLYIQAQEDKEHEVWTRFLNNVEDDFTATEQQRLEYCEAAVAEEEYETNLRDYEEMVENEGWMYLCELGFSTWDDYERGCVSDENEERAEAALREEEADCEAWERWMERRECDGETERIADEILDEYADWWPWRNDREWEDWVWNDREWEDWERHEFAYDIAWDIPFDHYDEEDHEQELDQADRNADREAYYEPEDDAHWVDSIYGLALHRWGYQPGDAEGEEREDRCGETTKILRL